MSEFLNHSEICPVCKGSGIYEEWHYYGSTTGYGSQATCHGCQGKGWVTVPDAITTISGGI